MDTQSASDLAFILLAHNEATTIEEELRTLHDVIFSKLPGMDVIVAEDGSTDGTRERLVSLQKELGFRIVGGAARKGYARAVLDAIASSDRHWTALCDGGMKHAPEDFWALWNARGNADMVVGRKTNRTDQIYRRALTAGFNFLLRTYFHVDVHDADSGLRIMNRKVIDQVIGGGLKFRSFVSTEIVVRASLSGLRYREVPITYRQRHGASRALPLKRIPKAVFEVLGDMRALKGEIRA
jgi:glycosyltransferase involved in cell wall biosynthesis